MIAIGAVRNFLFNKVVAIFIIICSTYIAIHFVSSGNSREMLVKKLVEQCDKHALRFLFI